MRAIRPVLCAGFCASVFLLAACGEDAEVTEGDDGREAAGEILEGSISDAMIATDEVRSQAPRVVELPAAREVTPADPSDAGDEAVEAGDAEEPAEVAAEPASPAAPEAAGE